MKSELTTRELSIQGLSAEVEHQKRLRGQQQEQQEQHIAALEESHRKATSDAIEGEKKIQFSMAAKISELTQQRDEAETRLAAVERDLSHIRTNMLGILQGKGDFRGSASAGPDMSTIQAVSKENPSSVDDYLKRLGY
jgi:chromosome segregation ATPase